MALPNLPVQGQNPWFADRENWDLSVEQDLEGRLSDPQLQALRASPIPNTATSGYERTVPRPSGVTIGMRMLMRDPIVPGRVWGKNLPGDGSFGYSDDEGVTFVKKFNAPEESTAGASSMRFWNGFVWLLQNPTDPSLTRRGQLWRSPYPDSLGNGWNWTKVFDLNSPPPGFTTGLNSTFRSDSVFGDGADVFLLEYSPAKLGSTPNDAVEGGPSLYYSPNSGGTWYRVARFTKMRHGHAGMIINRKPFITGGDAGNGWTDRGLWSAPEISTSAVWTKRSLSIEGNPGYAATDLYGINMIAMNVSGAPMIIMESDGRFNSGPLVYQGQSVTGGRPIIELNKVPVPYFGSMRHICLTPEGNLMWLQTGESGSIGDYDTVMISKGPFFSESVALESVPASSNLFFSAGDSVLDGDYVWFGHHRIRRPIFPGQVRVIPPNLPNPPIVPNPPITFNHEWVTPAGADGVTVPSWVDTVGGANLAQSDSSAVPVIATSSGVRAVRFDGVNDFLQATGIALNQPCTILMRMYLHAYGANGGGFLAPDGPGFNARWDSAGRPYLDALAGSNGDMPLGQWVTVAFVVAGGQSQMVINGVTRSGTGVGDLGLNSMRVGYTFQAGAGRFSQMDVSKLRIYRTALQGTDLTNAIAAMS